MIEHAQRKVLSTLLNSPESVDKYLDLCNLVKWSEAYEPIYKSIRSGVKSIFLIAEETNTKIHVLEDLVKVPIEPFLTDLIYYLIEHTNKELIISELTDLVMGRPTLDGLNTRLNAICGHISGLFRNTSYDMEKLNLMQSEAVEKQKTGGMVSLKTGIPELSRQVMGWHKGHLTVIGANSSAGKTAFALTCLKEAAMNNDCSVAIISYELTPLELHARLIAGFAEVQPRDILFTPLSDEDFNKFRNALTPMEKLKIIIDEPEDNDIETLVAKLKYLKSIGVQLVCIDFLQLLRDKTSRSKIEAVGNNARRLKNVAKQLQLPIIVISQLNRENFKTTTNRPTIASLRDSGEIEEAADEVILLYRPEYFLKDETPPEYKGKVELIFAKGRSTGTGTEIMNYDTNYQIFTSETISGKFGSVTANRTTNTQWPIEEGKTKMVVRNPYEVERGDDF